jgi:hypothetical protein
MWDELPDDVRTELEDSRFASRTHGTRGTYAKASDGGKGCRGPLCKKAERDDAEKKYAQRQANRGKKVVPGSKNEDARARDELLTKIQNWHSGQRYLTRLNKLVQSDTEEEEVLEAVI